MSYIDRLVEYQRHSIDLERNPFFSYLEQSTGDYSRRTQRIEDMFIEVLDDVLFSGMTDVERVKELDERGFTRKQIAEELCVSKWTVNRILSI